MVPARVLEMMVPEMHEVKERQESLLSTEKMGRGKQSGAATDVWDTPSSSKH